MDFGFFLNHDDFRNNPVIGRNTRDSDKSENDVMDLEKSMS